MLTAVFFWGGMQLNLPTVVNNSSSLYFRQYFVFIIPWTKQDLPLSLNHDQKSSLVAKKGFKYLIQIQMDNYTALNNW